MYKYKMINNRMKKTVFALLMAVVCVSGMKPKEAKAHAGHDQTPGSVQAPHGGVVQGTRELYLELVNDASGIKLYPLTHDLAPIAPKEITLTGSAQAPKKAKVPVKLSVVEDHFEGKIDMKGAYRYTLELSVGYKGKKEKASFQVEPQN